ncbi:glycosyltransferase family 9 protein [Mucilaginibacter segetis]|uniref:Glycosyltransferase family 9 protein n=1 Tax=Mucilaginibacter segetis TaxID=2793071 RepID=A0A934PSG8_9SPHI|nr:glycosyltransferase family 9 protein [Mucilaginibacter segetis]MBK0378133.1 glycosyltransferase family 9 protein [Mucilaginibacter segetis]
MTILIRLPNWLGDVVMSTAFINAVKQTYPDAIIDVILKKELTGIGKFIPGINKIHSFSKQEFSGLTGVYRFGKALRAERYNVFFNLPHSLSSAVMARATKVEQRIGFNKEGGNFLLTHSYKKPQGIHRVDEYLYLLEQFTGKPVTNKEVRLQHLINLQAKADHVVVNFNSEATSRRMPVLKARSILNSLLTAFSEISFILIGSKKEAVYVNEIINGLNYDNRIENYVGKTDLAKLVNLTAGSRAVLTTDSGPAHLSNSLGTPTVVLFGAGNENNTAPYNKKGLTIIRYGGLTCEPCVRNTCKLYDSPKCMELLDEYKIIKALSLQLNDT